VRATLALAAVLLVAIALGVVVLDASGAPNPSTTAAASPPGGSICADPGALTSAHITRDDLLDNPLVFGVPAKVTVTDRGKVHALASALCTLPLLPKGPIFCPADLGVRYLVVFSAKSVIRARVTIELGGCETVTGLDGTRWASKTPRLWHVLADALGRPHATYAEIAGRLNT